MFIMALAVREFQPTPNPNALKCVLSAPMEGPIRSFRTPKDADGHPLAMAIFALPGVTGLLLSGSWLTVNKSPEADWKPIRQGVQSVLAQVPQA